jgi:DNA-binding NarL/FixJ family response regulator
MSSLSILIADDHEVVRRGVRTLLEGRPEWTVCGEAATGRETIEKARKLRPDLVLLDLTMPELDGIDAISQILTASPGVTILVLTMHDSGEMATRVLAAGASGLTPRELEVLGLLALGRSNKEVAVALDISVKTVDVHRASVMRKLNLDTYSDLIQFAIRNRIIEL